MADKKMKPLKKGPFAVVDIKGLETSTGTYVMPGLSNSFLIVSRWKWMYKYREYWLPFAVVFTLLLGAGIWAIIPEYNNDKAFDEIALVEFGDVRPMQKKVSRPVYEIDDVFGNEYVKKKEEVVKVVSTSEIFAGTQMAGVPGGATRPVDLTPEIQPQYTPEARSAAIEGTVVIEIIVDEQGNVTHARIAKDTLQHGLGKEAIKTYRKKKFSPAIGPDGKAMKVKFYQPVRFQLL